VDGTPMCNFCFRGHPHPEEKVIERDTAKIAQGRAKFEVEENMHKPFARVEELQADYKAGISIADLARKYEIAYITAAKYAKAKTENPSSKRRPRGRGQTALGLPTLTATPELVKAVWAALPLEKQAALLNKLPEV
jgi:hypothetical protein